MNKILNHCWNNFGADMIIQSIKLDRYRNYNTLDMAFDKGINILFGDNAQGKTNVLESIYMCATTKSHKSVKDKDVIQFNHQEAHIQMNILKDNHVHKIDMHLRKNKSKGAAIDGIPIKKTNELFGLLHVIFFSPEDLSMIKNGPSERRKFIDLELCQLDKIYLYHLKMYTKILHQRNSLLKQLSSNSQLINTLGVWDIQLVQHGKIIIQLRKRFIESLNNIMFGIHKKLSGGLEEILVSYEPCVTERDFETKLADAREKDIRFKTTHVGPHRDDIRFLIQNIDIRKFGSQGQQRTAALSLKLSEIELVKKTIHDNPVLLLDDVLSELDMKRQNYLIESIQDIQTIITCTGVEDFIQRKMNIHRVYYVNDGTVMEKNLANLQEDVK